MSRLLIYTEVYARGGGNRYMVDLTNALSPLFVDTLVITNRGGLFEEDVARIADPYSATQLQMVTRALIARRLAALPHARRTLASIALVPIEPLLMLINVFRFVRILSRLRPTFVVSCNGGYPAAESPLALIFAAHLCGIPATLSVVSMPTRRRAYAWPYDWLIDRLTWRSADCVVANAELIARALVNERGADMRRLAIVHNGVDDISPEPEIATRVPVTLGCVARMDRMKGVMVLLEAFAALVPQYPSLRLVLAGQGDADADLRRRCSELGLDEKVSFLGHYTGDVAQLLATFDLFVFPSFWEGFPYSVVEAMRSARVIVATNVGGIPEAISQGEQGLLVEPRSADQIAAAVDKLLRDAELRVKLASGARRRYLEELSLERMHERMRLVLSSLIGRSVA